MNKSLGIILLFALPGVHLQTINHCYVTTICNTETSAIKTISEFWHKATDSCEPDAKNLFEMRKKIQEDEENYHYDLFNELLSAHIDTTLMELLFSQIMAKISTKTSNNAESHNLDQIINDLYTEDRKFILKVWQQVLDATVVFMDMRSIIQHILLNEKNNQLKLDLLYYLLHTYENPYPVDQRVMPALVYAIITVEEATLNGDYIIKAYKIRRKISRNKKIPKPLATLYLSDYLYGVSLFTRFYSNNIFPDFKNGPAENKRFITPLSFQRSYNNESVFKVETNAEGMVAFGAFYKSDYQYIVAEDHSALVCLNCPAPANGSQWWQVLWPMEDKESLAFQNTATGELLCVTDGYKENYVLISMLAADKHRKNPACHWQVYKKTRIDSNL